MSDRHNDPGLSALNYRAGTHASFKAGMLARLGKEPALARLTTRRDDDPTVALLDAWAVVLDVLTFYQERIANEGFVRTATERRSVLELARAIGYELNPGVAASAYLTFTVNTLEGSPTQMTVAAGTRVQSIPVEEALPQTFETLEPLEARAEWNALSPTLDPMVPQFGATQLHVRGVSNRIAKGDLILVIGDEGIASPSGRDFHSQRVKDWDVRRVKDVTTFPPRVATADPTAGYTTVVLDHSLGGFIIRNTPDDLPGGPGGPLGGPGGPLGGPGGNDPFDLPGGPGPINLPDIVPVPYLRTAARIYVFRQRAALFGHNAPDWRSMSTEIQNAYIGSPAPTPAPTNWPRFNLAYADSVPALLSVVSLDAVYPNVVVDSWIMLSTPARQELYVVRGVTETARTDFTLTAKTTRLTLDRTTVATDFPGTPRSVVVFTQSERLDFAPLPSSPAVSGMSVTVTGVEGLPAGRAIVAAGGDPGTGDAVSEVVFLSSASAVGQTTQLNFTTALLHTYAPETMTLHANVALATHGQSSSEVFGSGNASLPFQKFALKQKPLTYVAAANASGAESTLVVRVNGVEWNEVPSFSDSGPEDRVYLTRVEDDGTVLVQFGDGVTGARLPTGAENVSASYRVGLGSAGLVEGGRISLLLTRPLGLDGVVNHLASAGGADPQTLDEARQHAPLTVLTLDRIVSLRDFEDFAGAFAGIGKAQAALVWNGQRRVVHLTVGGVAGAAVDANSNLLLNLRAAIDAARQTDQLLEIDSYRAVGFRVEARITIDPSYVSADVLANATSELLDAFAFSRRGFGESVTKSQVLATLQEVEGVVAIDLDALYLLSATRSLETLLPARRTEFGAGGLEPAELLTLAAEDVILLEA